MAAEKGSSGGHRGVTTCKRTRPELFRRFVCANETIIGKFAAPSEKKREGSKVTRVVHIKLVTLAINSAKKQNKKRTHSVC